MLASEIFTLMHVLSAPQLFVEVKQTKYVPVEEYVCVGFWLVEVFPSPKSQSHELGLCVDKSVNEAS